ncbi:hypothetical protein HS088_TW04G00308 [Tripterygium wilfordii]|uniref:Myb-related protein 123 n=1 Tax=Tripterygium wilfordii TaxID=458696 RepID=A0A7J7DPT2_TRIWF|nr:transcription factor MYB123-like [Tripterygium wilfordii]KAF5748355.1 hypothetical protein HS088_TW04G00308 [Tripterygium wilfordii]
MGRSPCCSKEGLNRGAWTALEDNILANYITAHGEGKWRNLPKRAGLKRCGKSCRLRWLNYLRPDIKRGNISDDEEELIIRLHKLLGNRWSLIAGRLPGRTDNEIKNYWNTSLRKKAKLASESSSEKLANESQTSSQAPKLIRPNASKVLVPVLPAAAAPPPPPLGIRTNDQLQTSTPLLMDDQDPQRSGDLDYLNVEDCGNLDLDYLLNFDGECDDSDYNKDLSSIMGPDHHQYLHEDLLLKEYDNANLELESLALLLNSEEWPVFTPQKNDSQSPP